MHDRSISLALEVCEFFVIDELDAHRKIRDAAQRFSDEWREALRQVGVSRSLARQYEPVVNDQTEIALAV